MWKPTPPPHASFKVEEHTKLAEVGKFIYQIGELPDLREPSTEVPLESIKGEEFKAKLAYLKDCLWRYRKITGAGRGITAIQVGIPDRFSIIYMPEVPGEIVTIINPVITKKAEELLKYPEMCMSCMPIIAATVRPAWIEFEYYDEEGKKQVWNTKADDKNGRMYNRVFQHELDHMDGIVNIDRVESKSLILESDPAFYDTATFETVQG